ncbi:MAG: transglutaminase, partial [Betaproteobacteria bacterium]|nr:transglutaminase [Betaproteobacteria bacterium]
MQAERRQFLDWMTGAFLSVSSVSFAQTAKPEVARTFNPSVGQWKTFDVTTRVNLLKPHGKTR